jgi:hypothetical protein
MRWLAFLSTPSKRTGLTFRESYKLNVYLGECGKGIVHTQEWDAEMAALQRRFDSAVLVKQEKENARKKKW